MNSLPPRNVTPRPDDKTGGSPRAEAPAERHLDSGTLFAGGSEVVIAHGDELYRLRLTRQNRLILTK